ncbi:MotA/TolQ/ExbB proton channel family protein [Colwellia asteriadis]|uniref:MotA/TolQ/ExbB proton channel family protein n=1 Tax=Colwellia asteriadis TaxID=517723 RepID=A0ABN1L702_9GAMM
MTKKIILTTMLMALSISAFAATEDNSKVINDLLSDIKSAQSKLESSQKKLTKSREKLAVQVREQEQLVAKLREKSAVSQRLQDEKTLSLQQLQNRLKTWTEQKQYQQNILSRFNHNMAQQPFSTQAAPEEKLAWLTEHLNGIDNRINPTWQSKKVVMPNGELNTAKVLALGPVKVFANEASNTAGFVSMIDSDNVSEPNSALLKAELVLATDESAGLFALMNTGSGTISFDPTLTRAFKINSQKETIIDHIGKGGIWIFPIVAFGVFALIIALLKAIQFVRLPSLIPAFNERFAQLEKITNAEDKIAAQQSLFAQAQGMQAKLIEIALNTEIGQKRDDRLFSNLLGSKHKLEYWLGAIAITAAVSPLLGLLGTVSGMIETFKLMTLFGAGDPAAVSGGISQALVTTELGLVVAIPALLLHALLSRRVKTYYGALESCGVNLSQLNNDK